MQTSFTDLFKQFTQQTNSSWQLTIPEDWMQGRTTYGGLSAALCLQATYRTFSDLPPLRSAQVTFIGPAGGPIEISCQIIRQGKSVTYIEANMHGEKGIATRVLFCFGESRPSKLNRTFLDKPQIPGPDDAKDFFAGGQRPLFAQHFNALLAKGASPATGSPYSDHYIWAKHNDEDANDLCALIAIGDMPPPAVLPMFENFAPISSMTWSINIISDAPTTENGWWLLRTQGDYAHQGYSSQNMEIWNTQGELVITGRQNVAIFY
jgi:acyl-CoA thioesterase